MQKRFFLLCVLLTFFFFLSSVCAQSPKRQMRAVWIATVGNIDWPSKKGLSSDEQKAEMISLLDSLKAYNINTVIFQARPCGDAFYKSELEPWSIWLSGTQGVAPEPFYDPLDFFISEAHKRCMEAHVWINPFRALHVEDTTVFAANHFYKKRKDLFVKYGGKYYLDPGKAETREYLNKVVSEIVCNYDVDAVHLDDYFYPYPVKGESFPDYASFKKDPRGFEKKEDWRRDNVNITIRELNRTIKSIKPWVNFGISPFGVWRHKSKDARGSDTQKGLTNYDDIFADVLFWLKNGMVDYITPQLYWEIGKKNADYKVLNKWWSENHYQSNLYTGLYVSGLSQKSSEAWKKPNEIVRQMRLNQEVSEIEGEMFYSAKYFVQNVQGLNDSLRSNFYQKPALVPQSKIVERHASPMPEKLRLEEKSKKTKLCWESVTAKGSMQISYYVVYAFEGKKCGDFSDSKNILTVTTNTCFDITKFIEKIKNPHTFAVTAVNRYRVESAPSNSVLYK